MTDHTERIHQALGSIAMRPAGYAYLGRGDNSGVIVDDPNKRTAWYYTANQPPATAPVTTNINILALNRPEMEGTRVQLGFPPSRPNVLHIVDFDYGEGLDSVKGITPQEQLQASMKYVDVGSLINFRLAPNNPIDSEVYINPGWYRKPDGGILFWGGDSTDGLLAAAIAALSSGTHLMAAVFVSATDNTPAIVTNTAEPGGQGDKQVFDTTTLEEMSIPAEYLPCGAVHLYYGQTLVTEDDIYRTADPRTIFQTTSVGNTDSGLPLVIAANETYTVTANRQLYFFAGLTVAGTFNDNPDSIVEIG